MSWRAKENQGEIITYTYLIGEFQRHNKRTRERSKRKSEVDPPDWYISSNSYRTRWKKRERKETKKKSINYMWRLNIACSIVHWDHSKTVNDQDAPEGLDWILVFQSPRQLFPDLERPRCVEAGRKKCEMSHLRWLKWGPENTNHFDTVIMLDIRLFITIDFNEDIIRFAINRLFCLISEEWQHLLTITAIGQVEDDGNPLLAVS